MVSLIEAQRDILLGVLKNLTRGDEWKVLVLDTDSKRLIDNVLDQDAILNENITNIELITERRPQSGDTDAIYFLTPQPLIVDCLMIDFQRRRYRSAHLVWTSLLHPALKERIDQSPIARGQISLFRVLNVEFFPRESHLATFRDPWSFPMFFHPVCENLVRQHMEDVAQKIVGVCVSLGEYPTIRYYQPPNANYKASSLCHHLAKVVQAELDLYAKYHTDFPPQVSRPRGVLYITDRTMDLFAPFLHEFTYQAMAHDLLPIAEGDTITYCTIINEGAPNQEIKDLPIAERDRIWVENRHRHMKDTIDKLMSDFQRFIKDNPNFTKDSQGGSNSLNAIKDMMAGLPQFQELKEAYSLHLGMAQESMNLFQKHKLAELGSLEQILSTGLDEDYKKPKGVEDTLVRLLDEESILPSDRLRLLILYVLYRDGILPSDLNKLISHASLSPQNLSIIKSLTLLGAHTSRGLKDPRPPRQPLFGRKSPPNNPEEGFALSRYEPILQTLLELHASNALPADRFPYTRPPLDVDDPTANKTSTPAASSLRSAKPTWAKTRPSNSSESHQRVIVFIAGGATYSESRVCYTTGKATAREVFLVTSHMLSPALFVRQISDLAVERRRLDLPVDRPVPRVPREVLEEEGGHAGGSTGPGVGPAVAAPVGGSTGPIGGPAVAVHVGGGSTGAAAAAPAERPPAQRMHTAPTKMTEKKDKKRHHFFGKKDRH
ncbi:Sec1-like protein [Piedraia hortae CBS 480.64]|uniref:Sec1-like protein n=1 Tax=Piedraia hortae CBS 480.64 TaxID=1314780 RepID=A0A6A7C0S0_9PEZI|nr:Sec1-like protein [Piedraia hortae CBS 480.64]